MTILLGCSATGRRRTDHADRVPEAQDREDLAWFFVVKPGLGACPWSQATYRAGPPLNPLQGSLDVAEQMSAGFEPSGKAHQRVADAELGPLFGLEARMRGGCG